jgi:hypothetical protein
LNSQFEKIASNLNQKEKEIFIKNRDSIKTNPCKKNK